VYFRIYIPLNYLSGFPSGAPHAPQQRHIPLHGAVQSSREEPSSTTRNAGHPSASADNLPLGVRVHNKSETQELRFAFIITSVLLFGKPVPRPSASARISRKIA